MNLADYFTPDQRAQGAADLRSAARVIKLNGWTQGTFARRIENLALGLSPVCAMGAINLVAWKNPNGVDAGSLALADGDFNALVFRQSAMLSALATHLGIDGCEIPGWNDREGRTAEEVIGALNAAAIVLEEAK